MFYNISNISSPKLQNFNWPTSIITEIYINYERTVWIWNYLDTTGCCYRTFSVNHTWDNYSAICFNLFLFFDANWEFCIVLYGFCYSCRRNCSNWYLELTQNAVDHGIHAAAFGLVHCATGILLVQIEQ